MELASPRLDKCILELFSVLKKLNKSKPEKESKKVCIESVYEENVEPLIDIFISNTVEIWVRNNSTVFEQLIGLLFKINKNKKNEKLLNILLQDYYALRHIPINKETPNILASSIDGKLEFRGENKEEV